MIIIERIKKIYLKLFFLSPKLLSTIIFIPFLYILGWVLAKPLLLLGLDKEILSLVGTIFTFLIFVFSLPKWFHIRWGLKNAWTLLGINNSERNGKFILYFIRGFLLSTILISLILIPIITAQWGYWIGRISIEIILNSIFLIIGIGFAEELIFRGWLLEEFKKQFGLKNFIVICEDQVYGMTLIEELKNYFTNLQISILKSNSIKNDFNIIRSSKLAILGNSTFSWWASFLSISKKEFLVPLNFSTEEKRMLLPNETLIN